MAGSVETSTNEVAVRTLQPTRFGGLGQTFSDLIATVGDIAAHDGLRALRIAMLNSGAHEVAERSDVSALVWADPKALIATAFSGDGTLADGQLSGRWTSVIGAAEANWLLLPVAGKQGQRVLVARDHVEVTSTASNGLACDIAASAAPVDHVFSDVCEPAVISVGVGLAAAALGAAHGLWRAHVNQVQARLATEGGPEVDDGAAATVARVAADIDAARLQLRSATSRALPAALWSCRQVIARSVGAADQLLASSRYSLDATNPATELWRDVQTVANLANLVFDDMEKSLDSVGS